MSIIMLITLVVIFAVVSVIALLAARGGPRVTTIVRTKRRKSEGEER
jgi:hypothetical protein